MDKTIEELVKSCRPYLSKKTRFLHFDGPYEKKHDSIPLYENFLFALSLMRLKEKELFLEGKELLERLLRFQVGNNFPRYLHDYPMCYHNWQSGDLLEIFDKIEKDWSHLLGEEVRQQFLQAKQHLASNFNPHPDLFDRCLKDDSFQEHQKFWNPFKLLLEDGLTTFQEGYEPKKTLMDHALAYLYQVPPKNLSPEFLKLTLLAPQNMELPEAVAKPTLIKGSNAPKQPAYTLYWKQGNSIHTLSLFTTGSVNWSDNHLEIHLPDTSIQDEKEIYFYIDRKANPAFYSEEKRASAFTLDQTLDIRADGLDLSLSFEQEGPNAQYYGHIALGNRPNQLINDLEAYDWSIAIRTVRREGPHTLRIRLSTEESLDKVQL